MEEIIINEQPIHESLESNYMPYAMSVIISRALPLLYDSFKPSHRKALYMAHLMNLYKERTKSANLVGQTMKLNPHGDQAIYETIVRMVDENESLLVPYFDGKGNFGKTYSRDMAYAHQRYTETGLAKICNEIFEVIDKNVVEFEDNYDGKMKEPKVLPVTFPNILVNPTKGIAVGMASNMCSFNLKEVCEATIQYIQTGSTDEIMLSPDFSTKAQYLLNEKELESIHKIGRGKITLKAKYEYNKKENCIEVKEIPYTTTVEAIMDKIETLVKLGKIKEVSDLRDETDLKGLCLSISLKRGTNVDLFMEKLFRMTPLKDSFVCNFNVLVYENGDLMPKVLGVHKILELWCEWRRECIRKEITFDLDKKSANLHMLKGIEKLLLNIDRAVSIVKNSETDEEVIKNFEEEFEIDKVQAEYVANIRLRNFNKKFILQKTKDISNLENEIQKLEDTLNDPNEINEWMISQLQNIIQKYGKDRLTEISYEESTGRGNPEDLIDDTQTFVAITRDGYMKKLARKCDTSTIKVKDGDEIILTESISNKGHIFIFTNKGNCYTKGIYDFPVSTPSLLGNYLPSMLKLKNDEEIIHTMLGRDYEGDFLFVFEDGKARRFTLDSLRRRQRVTDYKDVLLPDSTLFKILIIKEETELVCISGKKALVVSTEELSARKPKTSVGKDEKVSKANNRDILMKLDKNKIIDQCWLIDDLDHTQVGDFNYYRHKRSTKGSVIKRNDKFVEKEIVEEDVVD